MGEGCRSRRKWWCVREREREQTNVVKVAQRLGRLPILFRFILLVLSCVRTNVSKVAQSPLLCVSRPLLYVRVRTNIITVVQSPLLCVSHPLLCVRVRTNVITATQRLGRLSIFFLFLLLVLSSVCVCPTPYRTQAHTRIDVCVGRQPCVLEGKPLCVLEGKTNGL